MDKVVHPVLDPEVGISLGSANITDRGDLILAVAAVLGVASRTRCPDADEDTVRRSQNLASWLVVAAHAQGGDDEAAALLAGPTNALKAETPPRNFVGELLVELRRCAGGNGGEENPVVVLGFADLLGHIPDDPRAANAMRTLRGIAGMNEPKNARPR